MRVLLAEDDEDVLDVTTHLFARRGWTVTTATTGEEALAAMTTDSFDVAVLDQNMPPGSGLEVAASRREAGDATPMVLWTGWGGSIDHDLAHRLDVHVLNKSEVGRLAVVVAELGGAG